MKIRLGYVDKRRNYREFAMYSLIVVMMRKVKMLWLSREDMSPYYDNTPKSAFD